MLNWIIVGRGTGDVPHPPLATFFQSPSFDCNKDKQHALLKCYLNNGVIIKTQAINIKWQTKNKAKKTQKFQLLSAGWLKRNLGQKILRQQKLCIIIKFHYKRRTNWEKCKKKTKNSAKIMELETVTAKRTSTQVYSYSDDDASVDCSQQKQSQASVCLCSPLRMRLCVYMSACVSVCHFWAEGDRQSKCKNMRKCVRLPPQTEPCHTLHQRWANTNENEKMRIKS